MKGGYNLYNIRQQKILDFLKLHKTASRAVLQEYIAKLFPSKNSRITLIRDLDLLVKDGNIVKSGKAKATLYSYLLSTILEEINVETYFSKEQDERVLKSEYFNFEIFNGLKNLLSENEKEELSQINEVYIKNRNALSPAILKKEFERLTIELSWKSSQIEGNTYSLLDTERLIKEHKEAQGKTKEEAVMILNHKRALDFIYSDAAYFKKITISKIEDIHRLLIGGLGVSFGLRKNKVGITGTNYRPLDNVHQIREAVEKLIEIINQTKNPIEKSLIAVVMISYIQPFEDGNKRTARILGDALLLANDFCPLSYRSVQEVEYKKAVTLFYEQNNISYFKKLFIEQFKQAVEKYF